MICKTCGLTVSRKIETQLNANTENSIDNNKLKNSNSDVDKENIYGKMEISVANKNTMCKDYNNNNYHLSICQHFLGREHVASVKLRTKMELLKVKKKVVQCCAKASLYVHRNF